MKKIFAELIINTESRRSRIEKDRLLATLEDYGFEITHINEIYRHQKLDAAVRNIQKRTPQLVIAGGGDGTISALLDRFSGKDTTIGIVPLGTTNNFARSLNIPLDIEGAVRAIKISESRAIDLGQINTHYFANVAGIGISALVAEQVSDSAKKTWGRFSYTVTGLGVLFHHKSFKVNIEDKDRELMLNFETHQLIVANGRFHAGKQIAIDAKVDNSELILFALGGRSKLSFIWSMLDFYIGSRKYVNHSSYLIGRDVRITTKPSQRIELDGEVIFRTPARARVASKIIKIRYTP